MIKIYRIDIIDAVHIHIPQVHLCAAWMYGSTLSARGQLGQ